MPRRIALHDLPDEDLMVLMRSGETGAFEVMFDRHATVAYSLARRICRQERMAEDVVQEALLSVWRGAGRFDPSRGSVRTWVLSVVHHRAIDAVRRARVNDGRIVCDEYAVQQVAAPELTEVEVVRGSEAHEIRRALDQLPLDQRRVIELSYFDGLTHHQIAQLLDLPLGTVKGRNRLAMQKLRALMESGASDRVHAARSPGLAGRLGLWARLGRGRYAPGAAPWPRRKFRANSTT